MSDEKSTSEYSLAAEKATGVWTAPELAYQPRVPEQYRPKIGLIGCGGITQSHLSAYKSAGFDVVMLCDLKIERAEKRRDEFFPSAKVTANFEDILNNAEISVVDIATHPKERLVLIEAALIAKKHVLSQKPFVLNLDDGERLIALAAANNVKFAVNQNGRWAPHLSYLREAVTSGVIGELVSVHCSMHWDHSWTKGTPFENIFDLVFYDFAIHWFDFVNTLLENKSVTQISGMRSYAAGQSAKPPLLAQSQFIFDGGQGSLVFDAGTSVGTRDVTVIVGTEGMLLSEGTDLSNQKVTIQTKDGIATPTLSGKWFNDGFRGTMGELLCAIEENREPMNSAKSNLKSLALCYAAIASANEGMVKIPGTVRSLPKGSAPGV
jgi:predicted dehydrogenase